MKKFILFQLFCFFLLSGCSSVSITDYKNEKPILKLEEYLNGTIDAYGIFQDRSGLIKKRFHCIINASWKGSIGTLDEHFTYSDGTESQRVWTIKKTSENNYTGSAGDVIGEAKGETSGNAFYWKYVLNLEYNGSHYEVDFDDWMFLMDNKVMINRSVMAKFGINLGEVTLTFIKR
jgi:hypothetical protein